MKITYDNQDSKWKECIEDNKKKVHSKTWLRKDNLDSWRHDRMLEPIKHFISKNEKWLTIGDGRYGTEANFLIKNGAEAHATDLSDRLLKISSQEGFINSYSKQNAENLNFDDESFDYVLIKEALHHFPRPWIALYEAFRVCKKGVILIEPNDQLSKGLNLVKSLLFFWKLLTKKNFNFDDYNFEEVGNFIFTIKLREIEKFMLAMHYRNIGYSYLNDYYYFGVENINIVKPSRKDLIQIIKLKSIIFLKNILCHFKLSNYSLISIALLKDNPEKLVNNRSSKKTWKFKKLPKNPYIKKI